jgi:hypothetical protein
METHNHIQLKRLAHAWLLREGFQAVAPEVRTPIMRYRADVAGHIDAEPLPAQQRNRNGHIEHETAPDRAQRILPFDASARADAPRRRCEARTILVECKQSRADFLRDTAETDALLARRARFLEQKRTLEREFLPKAEPSLRRGGEFLFADMERWDFSRSRSPAYRALIGEIESIDRALYNQTKFFWMAQYRMADRLFLIAPRGMIKPRELPDAWGLIECPRRLASSLARATLKDLADVPLTLRVPPRDNGTRPAHRARLLRNIAVAATRAHLHADASPVGVGRSVEEKDGAAGGRLGVS